MCKHDGIRKTGNIFNVSWRRVIIMYLPHPTSTTDVHSIIPTVHRQWVECCLSLSRVSWKPQIYTTIPVQSQQLYKKLHYFVR